MYFFWLNWVDDNSTTKNKQSVTAHFDKNWEMGAAKFPSFSILCDRHRSVVLVPLSRRARNVRLAEGGEEEEEAASVLRKEGELERQ